LKTTREYVNIIDAFQQLGSYRAVARLLVITHKTVRRAVQRQQAGGPWSHRLRAISRNTDEVPLAIWDRVRQPTAEFRPSGPGGRHGWPGNRDRLAIFAVRSLR
jgi:hypothetical protein